jgi:hypothetical protein
VALLKDRLTGRLAETSIRGFVKAWLKISDRTQQIVGSRARALVEIALDVTAGRMSRGPCPLKIEAAEVTGNVDDFADEIKPGNGAGLERLLG